LTLTATDAWGNTTTSNMSVVESSMTVTNVSLGPNTLFQPTTSVWGYASEGTVAVWVNGVAARTDGVDVPGVTAGRLLRS